MGHNGIINYEVDIQDNKIEDLKILKHSETSGIFNQVIDKLKHNIIEDIALVEVDFDDPTTNVRGRRALAIAKPTPRGY